METAVQELLRDFFREANIQAGDTEIDPPLQRLVDDVRSDSAVCKRDLRRLLEKDSTGFLQAACRILKVSGDKAGVGPLLELLWSSSLALTNLIDPSLLSLAAATALANRWVAFDPMLDIKLLQIGFPLGEDDTIAVVEMSRPRRALDIVSRLPPNRHVLLSLAKLLRHPDVHVRSKAALLYARASRNPEWVRKMLAEPDARVRANAVEGLWETKSPFCAALFREAALDPDHRVAANALIGLHRCGEADGVVTDFVENMVHNTNPLARAAAAFAVGQIADANCAPILEGLLRDSDPGVRGEALRALIRFRRQDRTVATAEPGTAEAPVDASAPVPGELGARC
jgi:hypothetical protein